jgi:hypothetical protein
MREIDLDRRWPGTHTIADRCTEEKSSGDVSGDVSRDARETREHLRDRRSADTFKSACTRVAGPTTEEVARFIK